MVLFFKYIMKHTDRFYKATTLALPFRTSVLCSIAYPYISMYELDILYAKYISV